MTETIVYGWIINTIKTFCHNGKGTQGMQKAKNSIVKKGNMVSELQTNLIDITD